MSFDGSRPPGVCPSCAEIVARWLEEHAAGKRVDFYAPSKSGTAALENAARVLRTPCGTCDRHARLGSRTTHLAPCPQHPNEIAAGWGHMPCDCGLAPCSEHGGASS